MAFTLLLTKDTTLIMMQFGNKHPIKTLAVVKLKKPKAKQYHYILTKIKKAFVLNNRVVKHQIF